MKTETRSKKTSTSRKSSAIFPTTTQDVSRGQSPKKNPQEELPTFRYTLAGFARFCASLTTDKGKPLRLYREQKWWLRDFFRGVKATVIVIPKKNGKTTLLAALGLFHLYCFPKTADVLMVASSKDQARRMYDQAAELVRGSWLNEVFAVKTGYHFIWWKGGDSAGPKIAVKPAEAGTVDGVEPTLALVDELHRHRNLSLYTVIRQGLIDGQMVTISTAGANRENPLWEIRENVYKTMPVKRRGHYRYAADAEFAWHELALDDKDDPTDLRLVREVNPAPWQTPRYLKSLFNSKDRSLRDWARLKCGIWAFGEVPWIDPPMWDALRWDVGTVRDGDEVTVAIRVGVDAGIGVASLREDGRMAVRCELVSAGGDVRVSLQAVEFALRRVCRRYDVTDVFFDREQFDRSAEILEEDEVPMTLQSQSPKYFAMATSTFWRYVAGGLLGHDGEDVLRDQVLAGVPKEDSSGWHLSAASPPGLLATVVAVHEESKREGSDLEYVSPTVVG